MRLRRSNSLMRPVRHSRVALGVSIGAMRSASAEHDVAYGGSARRQRQCCFQ